MDTPTLSTTVTNNKDQQTSPRKLKRMFDIFRSTSQDLGFEKQKKQALYNLIAFSVFLFLIITVICCYFILQQFLRPLFWALMFGFLLHPFKRKLNLLILNWIDGLNDTHRPAILEFLFLPLNLINYCLTTLSRIIIQYGKLLGLVFFALLFIHLTLYYFIFAHKIWLIITSTLLFVFNLLKLIQSYSNLYVLLTLAVGHFVLLCFSWNENTKDFLCRSTPFIWIILLCKILLFNTIGTLFFIALVSMLAIGLISKFYGINSTKSGSQDQPDSLNRLSLNIIYIKDQIWNFILSLLPSHLDEDELDLVEESVDDTDSSTLINEDSTYKNFTDSPIDASSPLTKQVSFSVDNLVDSLNDESKTKLNKTKNETSSNLNKSGLRKNKLTKGRSIRRNSLIDKDSTKQSKSSDLSAAYLYALVWSCLLAQIYIRPRLLYLLPIPMSLFAIKWIWNSLQDIELFVYYSNEIKKWIDERQEAIYNPIFCFIYDYLLISDYVLSKTLRKSVDTLSSLFLILIVIFGAIFATLFLAFQIYYESALLVELTANVMPTINSTYSTLVNSTSDSEFGQMLPKDLINNNIAQEILTKGYLHGREWIQTTIRTTFNGDNNPDSNVTSAVEKVS